MSIAQSIETLAAKVKDLKPIIETEEATKRDQKASQRFFERAVT